MSEKGVESILSGKTEPPPSALLRISQLTPCDLNWLAWGDEMQTPAETNGDHKNAPPATASGAGTTNPQLVKLAAELADAQAAMHLLFRMVLEGKFSAEAYSRILLETDKALKFELQQLAKGQESI